MSRSAARITVIVVVALGFLTMWASVAFDWPSAQWITMVGFALLAIGVAVGSLRILKRRRDQAREPSSYLSASDDYSDLQLGRRPITHFPRDEASTSQVGDPPQPPPRSL